MVRRRIVTDGGAGYRGTAAILQALAQRRVERVVVASYLHAPCEEAVRAPRPGAETGVVP